MSFQPFGRVLVQTLTEIQLNIQHCRTAVIEDTPEWRVSRDNKSGKLYLRHYNSGTESAVVQKPSGEIEIQLTWSENGSLCHDTIWCQKHETKAAAVLQRQLVL